MKPNPNGTGLTRRTPFRRPREATSRASVVGLSSCLRLGNSAGWLATELLFPRRPELRGASEPLGIATDDDRSPVSSEPLNSLLMLQAGGSRDVQAARDLGDASGATVRESVRCPRRRLTNGCGPHD